MRLKNERGIALVMTLFVVVVLMTVGGIFVVRTINEWNTANRERHLTQSFYISEGGAEAGLRKIDELINTNLRTTVTATNPQVLGNNAQQYAAALDAIGFLIEYVRIGGTALLTLSGTDAVYNQVTTNFGDGNYQYDIVFSPKGNPVVVNPEAWDFPYSYRIEATGHMPGAQREVLLIGDFTVRVQKDNFAKFALFTDHHCLPSGGIVWFTDKTNFKGPLHTNEEYSFAFNPSGIFDGEVTQQHKNARFYNNGSPFLSDADSNPGIDVPAFNVSYKRGEPEIVLSSSVQKADLYNQAQGGTNLVGNGIFIPNNGSDLIGGIFVRGDATIQMGVDGSDNAVYTISEGATTKEITVDIPNNETVVKTVGGALVHYSGVPDGIDDVGTIIYVDGNVTSLAGNVQRDTEVTISTEFDIVITDDLTYSDYTPAVGTPGTAGYVPPNADGATNLLGLVAWGGNVRVATGAPDDINMHGIIMARNGIFSVDNYNDVSAGTRGTATLLGGVITQFYGAFGLFNGTTGAQIAGYGRNFVYDTRTLLGKAPPYFPSMKTFIAFTNDITDKIVFQEGGF